MPTPRFSIRVDSDRLAEWRAAAESDGVTITELIHRAVAADLLHRVDRLREIADADDRKPRRKLKPTPSASVPCNHPRSARDVKGYATFCSKDKGGCGAKL